MQYVTAYLVPIVGVVIAFFVGKWVAGVISNLIAKSMRRSEIDETLTKFAANMIRYGIITLVVIACLGVFGIETTSFAAVIGAMGLAIGLAFQGTLSNISAGVMLIIFRPFDVGDFVTVAGVSGLVTEIGLFTVAMDTLDNRRVILPNSKVFGDTIENVTHNDKRRVDIDVGCDYTADIDQTRSVLEAAVKDIEGTVDPAQIFLVSLGASSVDWQVRVWCKTDDYWGMHERVIRAVKYGLDAANIGIPYPQMDVHLDNLNTAA